MSSSRGGGSELPRNGDTVAMLAKDAEAGYWLGLVMSISTAHHALEVRYYELYDGSDDRYYLDTNGRIHSCSTECIRVHLGYD